LDRIREKQSLTLIHFAGIPLILRSPVSRFFEISSFEISDFDREDLGAENKINPITETILLLESKNLISVS